MQLLLLLDMQLGQSNYNNKVMGMMQHTLQYAQRLVVPRLH